MRFEWNAYAPSDEALVEGWLDGDAKKNTGIDDWRSFYGYWEAEKAKPVDGDFGCRLISQNGSPFAVLYYSLRGFSANIMALVVSPEKRGLGLGSSALSELLSNGETLIGESLAEARAVIFPDNAASIRAFEKAGFVFESAHPDGDALYYRYRKSHTCRCGQDCSRCKTYLATVYDDDKLREESRRFYLEEFGISVPSEKLRCRGEISHGEVSRDEKSHGESSGDMFYLCRGCPWISCSSEKGLRSCLDCHIYPCPELAAYQKKYVNKCNLIGK